MAKRKYPVNVTRISYTTKQYEVEADGVDEAEMLAEQKAANDCFDTEDSAEYETTVTGEGKPVLTKNQKRLHKNLIKWLQNNNRYYIKFSPDPDLKELSDAKRSTLEMDSILERVALELRPFKESDNTYTGDMLFGIVDMFKRLLNSTKKV